MLTGQRRGEIVNIRHVEDLLPPQSRRETPDGPPFAPWRVTIPCPTSRLEIPLKLEQQSLLHMTIARGVARSPAGDDGQPVAWTRLSRIETRNDESVPSSPSLTKEVGGDFNWISLMHPAPSDLNTRPSVFSRIAQSGSSGRQRLSGLRRCREGCALDERWRIGQSPGRS